MKWFMLYKVAIISLLFTLSVDVVSMEPLSLEQAWKILNEDCNLNIPRDADLAILNEKREEFGPQKLKSLAIWKMDAERVPYAFLVIRDHLRQENAYKWIKENKQKIQEAAREKIIQFPTLTATSIIGMIINLFPLPHNDNYDDFDNKIIGIEANKIVADVINEMKKLQPQSEQKQPEPQSQKKQSAVEQPSPSKPVHVDPAGSEPKISTGSQSQSAKPNEHRLSKAAWVDYSGAATPFVVQDWLNDHYENLKKNITFFLKRQFDNDFLDVNKDAVWENSIKDFVEKIDSYNKMGASDKHILKNKICLIITEIEQNLKKEISIKESRENELRRRQQQAAFNPNASNMLTAALELASMLNR